MLSKNHCLRPKLPNWKKWRCIALWDESDGHAFGLHFRWSWLLLELLHSLFQCNTCTPDEWKIRSLVTSGPQWSHPLKKISTTPLSISVSVYIFLSLHIWPQVLVWCTPEQFYFLLGCIRWIYSSVKLADRVYHLEWLKWLFFPSLWSLIVQIPYSTDATPCWLEEKLRWYCLQPLSSISMRW